MMSEANEKRSGSTDPTPCSAADGPQLPTNAGRSADDVLGDAILALRLISAGYVEQMQKWITGEMTTQESLDFHFASCDADEAIKCIERVLEFREKETQATEGR